jgi:motility quorum-sensing regulator/GCU-specific mRNA interferase toxin
MKPHCPLSVVRNLIRSEKVDITWTATNDAAALFDFNPDMILDVVMALTVDDFVDKVPAYDDPEGWQDLYLPTTEKGVVYLKLQVTGASDDCKLKIVSFHEP